MPTAWFTYVLRCADDTLYVGVTTDLDRRVHEHNSTRRGARYTRARRPVQLLASWAFDSRSEAQQFEARFRKKSRRGKLGLIARNGSDPQRPRGTVDPPPGRP